MQPLCSGKAISITYSECVFVAVHFHLWPAWLYGIYPHYFINGTISEEKLLNIKCAFWLSLQLLSETLLILRINVWDVIKNVYWCSCEVPLYLSDFNETWTFLTDVLKILKYQISWKSIQCKPSCCMWTDTHDEANSHFLQFCQHN